MSGGDFRSKECGNCGFEFGAGGIAKRPWVTGRTRISGATSTGRGTSASTLYGSSGTISRRQGSRQSTRYSSGRTVTHEHTLWICNDCWEAEQARQRGEFLLKVVGGGILILGVVVYLALQGGGAATTNKTANAPAANLAPADTAASQAGPAEKDAAAETRTGPRAPEPRSEPSPVENEVIEVGPTNNAALRESILKALDDGRGRRWRGDGASGGVSVSSEQPAPGQTCRNYRYTVDGAGGDQAPHDETACRVDGGSWKLGS